MALTIMVLSFTLFLLLGIPVIFSIGLCSLATAVVAGLPLGVIFQKMVGGMQVSFLAIPFFIFAGELMLHGGIADKIVNPAKASVGHVRGGLGMANVVACTLFGGISGSAGADVSAMGAVLIPTMKKEGYDTDYAVNVTTHSALVGVLTPTSLNIIIFTGRWRKSLGSRTDPGLHPSGDRPDALQPRRGLLRGPQARLSEGKLAGLGHCPADFWFCGARTVRGGSDSWRDSLGHLYRHGIRAIAVLYSLILTALVYRSLSWDKFVGPAPNRSKRLAWCWR